MDDPVVVEVFDCSGKDLEDLTGFPFGEGSFVEDSLEQFAAL